MTELDLYRRIAASVATALPLCLSACLSTSPSGTTATSAGGISTSGGATGSSSAGASATGGATSSGSAAGGTSTGSSTGPSPVSTLAGGGEESVCADAGFDGVADIRLGPDGSVYVLGGQVYQVDAAGDISVVVPGAVLPSMHMFALGPDGGFYLAAHDINSAEQVDQVYTVWDGIASLLAGNGGQACGVTGSDGGVGLAAVGGLVLDPGGALIVTDISLGAPASLQSCTNILKVAPDGTTTNLAGNGMTGFREGSALQAEFSTPTRVVTDQQGNIFIADTGNSRIRKIAPDGTTSTLAGNGASGFADGAGTDAEFRAPVGLAIDANGNLYVGDTGNECIRKVTPQGVVSTIAGNGTPGSVNGTLGRFGTTEFNGPEGLAVTPDGSTIYVADEGECAVRVIQLGAQ